VIQVDTPEGMSANPADDYVRRFVGSADRSKVISLRSVMITPASIARLSDRPAQAIESMRKHALSTAYVVDHRLRLKGILTIADAVRAHREGLTIGQCMNPEVETCAPDETVHAILPRAAQALYPLAVVDDAGALMGIVTKAAVLSTLAQE